MTKEEIIEILSDIRAEYNLFNEDEEPKYDALSWAIYAIKHQCRWYDTCPYAEILIVEDENE